MRPYEKLLRCYDCFREKIDFQPLIGMTLGSGLGDYADSIDIAATLDYRVSTAQGHRGRFVFGYVEGVPVVVMQGRIHYYEGYDITDVVLPTRLMGLMGGEGALPHQRLGRAQPRLRPG